MVHADAADFGAAQSKEDVYRQVIENTRALCEGQRNWVCNTANVASLLWHAFHSLPAPSSEVNWAGFYVVDLSKDEQLILAPFQGKVACQTIAFGRGVCGAAAKTGATQLVPDVEQFPGHIACDGASKSEIVVPLLKNGQTVAIIDIDCAVENGFDHIDQKYLEELASFLADACDWQLPKTLEEKVSSLSVS